MGIARRQKRRYARSSDDSQHEKRAEKSSSSLKIYNIKDTFRCLITMWSIGIAKRGLNEHIFVKTSKSICFSVFFCFCFLPVAQNSPCAFTLILPACMGPT